jgi:hypothetical protein
MGVMKIGLLHAKMGQTGKVFSQFPVNQERLEIKNGLKSSNKTSQGLEVVKRGLVMSDVMPMRGRKPFPSYLQCGPIIPIQ